MSRTRETALSYFKDIDRYELQSATSIVFEEQVDELRRKGLLRRPVPVAFDWHDQMFYGEKEYRDGPRHQAEERLLLRLPVPHREHPLDGKRLTVVLTPIKSRAHISIT